MFAAFLPVNIPGTWPLPVQGGTPAADIPVVLLLILAIFCAIVALWLLVRIIIDRAARRRGVVAAAVDLENRRHRAHMAGATPVAETRAEARAAERAWAR